MNESEGVISYLSRWPSHFIPLPKVELLRSLSFQSTAWFHTSYDGSFAASPSSLLRGYAPLQLPFAQHDHERRQKIA